MIRRRTLAPAVINHGTPQKILLPRDVFLCYVLLRLTVAVTFSGGTANGTVISTNKFNPGMLIKKLTLRSDPPLPAGEEVVYLPDLLYIGSFKWLERTPERTALDSGSAAAHTASMEFVLPLAMPGSWKETLCDGRREILELEIEWPETAAAARDLLLSSNDRTGDFAGTKLEAIAYYVRPEDAKVPVAQFGLRQSRVEHALTGENPQEITSKDGEATRALIFCSRNNSIRNESLLSGSKQRVYNKGLLVHEAEFDRHADASFAERKIPDADRPTGAWFVDFDPKDDLADAPVPGSGKGEGLRIEINTGTTAPTSQSFSDYLQEFAKLTPEGMAAAASA